MTRAFVKTLLLACVTLLLAGVVFGQAAQTTGRIEGTAKDQTGGVIPGVTVTINSATGTKSMITGDSGEFAFPFLTPGNYDIKAELEGFKTYEQKGITIRLGLTTTINLVLSPGEISEVVTVTGEAPLVDTTTTTIGSNISDTMYTSMPVRRNFANLFTFAPGVNDSGVGGSNPSIGGASGLENNYVVDGVNITNTGYGSLGAYSNVYGSLGTGVNFDFVKEVQVKSGGFEAEYGQSTGGVVNVITKSGGNEFHGGVYFYVQPAGWNAAYLQPNTYRVNKVSETISQQNYDVSFDLSGYLWKDKLFFYAGFDPQWQTVFRHAPAGYGQDLLGINPYEQESHFYSWSAKATWVAHPNHTFEFSTFADPSNRSEGPNRNMLVQGDGNYSKLHFGSWNVTGRYNGVLTNNWFLTGSYSRAFNRFEEAFRYDLWQIGDYVQYFYQYYLPTHPGATPRNVASVATGGPGFFENNNGTNNQFNIKTTFNFSAGGEHTFDFGYAYEDVSYIAVRRYTGPMVDVPAYGGFSGASTFGGSFRRQWYRMADGSYWDRNGDGTLDEADALVWQRRGNYNDPNISTSTKYHSFYLQDAWKISPQVTFKAGIRYDYQKIAGGGPNSTDFVFDGNWAPRLGLIYDIKGDGKTKIYGSWGKFFQKIPQDLAVRALSVETGITSAFWADVSMTDFINGEMVAAGVTPYPGQGNPLTLGLTGSTPTYVMPDTKAMYQNEFVLGFDHELSPTMSLGARYIWRTVGRNLEDVGSQTPEQWNTDEIGVYQYVITNPSAAMDIFDNAAGVLGSDGIPDGFPDVQRSYNAFELTLEKRFAQGFQFLANYRLAKVWGNWEGLFRNDNGQDDPFITSLFDFRDDASHVLAASYIPGYLNTDRRHVLNFNGSYTMPNKLTFGIGARLTSGYPLTPVGTHPASGYGDGEIPGVLPDGTHVTRGYAGRSDWINNIDMHADYPFTFGDNYRLRFAVDMFNVFNLKKTSEVDLQSQLSGEPYEDYLTPLTIQRPFNMRFSIRFEF